MIRRLSVLLLWLGASATLPAKEILTNSVQVVNAPDWLTESDVDRTVGRIESYLEWGTRRIKVYFHADASEFKSSSRLNYNADAFFSRADQSVHLGPRVDKAMFDRLFGHEMVHAIFHQKYKGSIPTWLEEGFANYIGRNGTIDYKWIASQPAADVTGLRHPNRDATGSRYHYQVSTAAIEMIAAKCSLKDLLALSVGAKLTTYLSTYCEIKDVNAAFRDWVQSKKGEPVKAVASDDPNVPFWKKKPEKRWWEKDGKQ